MFRIPYQNLHQRRRDTVLDNTMEAAQREYTVNLNRNFIGIEMDEHYFEIAEKMINNAKQNLFA